MIKKTSVGGSTVFVKMARSFRNEADCPYEWVVEPLTHQINSGKKMQIHSSRKHCCFHNCFLWLYSFCWRKNKNRPYCDHIKLSLYILVSNCCINILRHLQSCRYLGKQHLCLHCLTI